MLYIVCKNFQERELLIAFLKKCGVSSAFHYLSLYQSSYYKAKHDGRILNMANAYTDRLLRLPFYYDLAKQDMPKIINSMFIFYSDL